MLSEDNVAGKIKSAASEFRNDVVAYGKQVLSDNTGHGFIKSNDSFWNVIKSKFAKEKNNKIGVDFVPHGSRVQEGVDPNSLHPTKDLDSLDEQRLLKAIKHGADKPIIVDDEGKVLDGHHRLRYAIKNKKSVDVSIGY